MKKEESSKVINVRADGTTQESMSGVIVPCFPEFRSFYDGLILLRQEADSA